MIDRRLNTEQNLEDAKHELIVIFEFHKRRIIGIECELLQEGEPSASSSNTKFGIALSEAFKSVLSFPFLKEEKFTFYDLLGIIISLIGIMTIFSETIFR